MGSQTTKSYKTTLSGSIGAGMGSLFAPGGRKYYILEHKVSSKYHRAGESQEIIVDNIEIGRDSHCQVRFDESFKTVSRHHAAIVKDGDMWKLVQISKTNSTLLNGHPVKTEWYLQNGDEIQLSINGPKLGFILPVGKKSTVGSIGLTRRLSLFRQQALRPYKTAITVLSCVLVLAISGLTSWNYFLRKDVAKQSQLLAEQIDANKNNREKADSLARELVESNKKLEGHEENLKKLKEEAARAWQAAAEAKRAAETVGTTSAPADLSVCYPYIYYISIYIFVDGERQDAYVTGTGFLLNDGRFVTAQHVVNLWESVGDQYSTFLNILAHNGVDVRFKMIAYSNSGDKIEIDYSPSSNPFTWGQYDLQTETVTLDNGERAVVKYSTECDYRDYAYVRVNKSGGLDFEEGYSSSLPAKTHLDILGFPRGVGAEDVRNITPIYSESSVAREGLDTDGCILLSNNETDHGNSGGPVLIFKDGKYKVVGILSGANRLGSKTGQSEDGIWKTRVVPISAMR